jgi:hypothetical protein
VDDFGDVDLDSDEVIDEYAPTEESVEEEEDPPIGIPTKTNSEIDSETALSNHSE